MEKQEEEFRKKEEELKQKEKVSFRTLDKLDAVDNCSEAKLNWCEFQYVICTMQKVIFIILQLTPWNVDTICHEGKSKTLINKSSSKSAQAALTDEEKMEKQVRFAVIC